MNVSPKRQQGLTFFGLILVLGFIGMFVLLVLKIAPIYLDHSKVASALADIEKTPDIQAKTEYEIRDSLNKRFNINYVYDVTQDDIKIIKLINNVFYILLNEGWTSFWIRSRRWSKRRFIVLFKPKNHDKNEPDSFYSSFSKFQPGTIKPEVSV